MSELRPRFVALVAAALAVAIAAVYARALAGPFVFDDQSAIVANETLRALQPLGAVLAQPPDTTISGRPLVALSLALNYAVSELDPRPYRATNALVHWGCALLLFGVVRRTLCSPRLARRFGERADGLALATAFLFALHPLASEAVCYVSARTESLMALFYLATLYLAIRARESARPRGWVAGAVVCCALGMASKEVMVSAPLVVALHDAIFWGKADGRARRVRIATWSGLASTWALLAALVLSAPRADSAGFEHWVSPLVYLWNQCRILPRYLALVPWPHPLLFDYGSPAPLGFGDVWPGALLLVGLFALTLVALWRWPAAGFVGIACFAVLSASSSVVPVASEVGAERRMYLPLMALLALGVCAAELLLARFRARALGPWLAGAAALALAAVSFARAGDYRTEIGLWQSDLRVAPDSRRAHYNLGKAFEREGRMAEAQAEHAATVHLELAFYTKVLPLQPNQVKSRVDLGAVYEMAGQTAQAEVLYREALERSPDDVYALWRMALMLSRGLGSAPPALDRALGFAQRAVAVSGRRDAAALEALAKVQVAAGRRDAAIATLRDALATDPAQQSPRVMARVRDLLTVLEGTPR
jgi:protein O-mannosyl-transferase